MGFFVKKQELKREIEALNNRIDYWRKNTESLGIRLGFIESADAKKKFYEQRAEQDLKARLEAAERKLQGKRVCDSYCEKCVHGIVTQAGFTLGGNVVPTNWVCALDCNCKDFTPKKRING